MSTRASITPAAPPKLSPSLVIAGGVRHCTVVLPDPIVTDLLTQEQVLQYADGLSNCIPISCDDMTGNGPTCNISYQL